jgi:hypothetical protein
MLGRLPETMMAFLQGSKKTALPASRWCMGQEAHGEDRGRPRVSDRQTVHELVAPPHKRSLGGAERGKIAKCRRACENTSKHSLRRIAAGHSSYLPVLQATIECQDAFSAYWTDLMGPANSLRELAARSCAAACAACCDACRQGPAGDPRLQQCADSCEVASIACSPGFKSFKEV